MSAFGFHGSVRESNCSFLIFVLFTFLYSLGTAGVSVNVYVAGLVVVSKVTLLVPTDYLCFQFSILIYL